MTLHLIHPDGDIILNLRRPNQPFAVQSDPKDSPPPSEPEHPVEDSPEWPRSPFEEAHEGESSEPAIPEPESLEEESSLIQFRLSSKHLVLTCNFFQRMEAGDWKETVKKGDIRSVEATDWDEKALLITLNIIHGLNKQVPRKIEPELLTKIAVIVDYYQCIGIMEVWFMEIWLPKLKDWKPKECGRDLTMRLCVAWILCEESVFKDLTCAVSRQTQGPLETLELPIPGGIVETIEIRRRLTIHDMLDCLHRARDKYLGEDLCSYECASIQLGALTKFMKSRDLFVAELDPNFPGLSAWDIAESLRQIRQPVWITKNNHYTHHCESSLHKLIPQILAIRDNFQGLDIINFL